MSLLNHSDDELALATPPRRSGTQPPPLSPPTCRTPQHILEGGEATCAVCFEGVCCGGPNIFTWPSCRHQFHLECAWLHAYNSGADVPCPLCRSILTQPQRMELLRTTHAARVLDTPAPPTPLEERVPHQPDEVVLLCCQRVGPPPDCAPYGDRAMSWSVRRLWRRNTDGQIEFRRHPRTGVLQGVPEGWWSGWTCHGCQREVSREDVPPHVHHAQELCCWGCGPMS